MNAHVCNCCKQEKSIDQFYRRKDRSSGRASICKVCDAKRRPSRAKRNPEKHKETMRRGNYRRWYGITLDDYARLLETQDGRCAICGGMDPGGGFKNFSVDHDHITGQLRGLLCVSCNRGLGLFHDDPVRLESAIQYLRNPHSIEQ